MFRQNIDPDTDPVAYAMQQKATKQRTYEIGKRNTDNASAVDAISTAIKREYPDAPIDFGLAHVMHGRATALLPMIVSQPVAVTRPECLLLPNTQYGNLASLIQQVCKEKGINTDGPYDITSQFGVALAPGSYDAVTGKVSSQFVARARMERKQKTMKTARMPEGNRQGVVMVAISTNQVKIDGYHGGQCEAWVDNVGRQGNGALSTAFKAIAISNDTVTTREQDDAIEYCDGIFLVTIRFCNTGVYPSARPVKGGIPAGGTGQFGVEPTSYKEESSSSAHRAITTQGGEVTDDTPNVPLNGKSTVSSVECNRIVCEVFDGRLSDNNLVRHEVERMMAACDKRFDSWCADNASFIEAVQPSESKIQVTMSDLARTLRDKTGGLPKGFFPGLSDCIDQMNAINHRSGKTKSEEAANRALRELCKPDESSQTTGISAANELARVQIITFMVMGNNDELNLNPFSPDETGKSAYEYVTSLASQNSKEEICKMFRDVFNKEHLRWEKNKNPTSSIPSSQSSQPGMTFFRGVNTDERIKTSVVIGVIAKLREIINRDQGNYPVKDFLEPLEGTIRLAGDTVAVKDVATVLNRLLQRIIVGAGTQTLALLAFLFERKDELGLDAHEIDHANKSAFSYAKEMKNAELRNQVLQLLESHFPVSEKPSLPSKRP